jgi:hypothetical protein
MSQNFESDFLKAARKLKRKNRKVLGQRIGKFFLISAIVIGLVYLLLKDDSPFRIDTIELSSKVFLLIGLGVILILGFVIYVIKLQAESKNYLCPKSSAFRADSLPVNHLSSIKGKYLIGFLILLIVIIRQANPSSFTNSPKDLLTRFQYGPTPPSLTSPWSWINHRTVHPAVASLPPDVEKSIKSVAEYIAQKEPDPYLRIKALHDYVTSRVTYDLNVLKTGRRPPQDAQTVFSTRKGVCEGYARLFTALGQAIDLDVVYITGKIRRDLAPADLIPMGLRLLHSDYDWTLHAWNAVKVAGNWQLVDTTWDDGDSYSVDYLMPPPEVMIASHLPEQSDWQLLPHPKNQDSFEKQLILKPQFFMESLEIISPKEYQTNVQKTALIQMKKPLNYHKKIGAVFAKSKAKTDVFSLWSLPENSPFVQENKKEIKMCKSQVNPGRLTQISCEFPETGDYQVLLVSVERGNSDAKKNISVIGQLKFHAL